MDSLTEKQKRVLEYLQQVASVRQYPPSVREICQALGFHSSSTAHAHLESLEKKGYIRKDSSKPRAIEILMDPGEKPPEEKQRISRPGVKPPEVKSVPVIGEVTAGKPILAEQNIEGYFPLPHDYLPASEGDFMLKVKGDSMTEAGINHGDLVIVRPREYASNGDIVVALLEDEATVKRFYKEENQIRLQPENPRYSPTYHQDVTILGQVIGLFRKMKI